MVSTIQDQPAAILKSMVTVKGENVHSIARGQPVLIVFLRHFGCVFCQEAMRDIAEQRTKIESKGVRIICVHMSEPKVAEGFFQDFNLQGIDHVSDPDCAFYGQFGLLKGDFNQLFGLKVWLRTAELAVKDLRRLKMRQIGDGFQMPGVFYIEDGVVKDKYIHLKASDRPNYEGIISCCQV